MYGEKGYIAHGGTSIGSSFIGPFEKCLYYVLMQAGGLSVCKHLWFLINY
jgi:hypothetical protein